MARRWQTSAKNEHLQASHCLSFKSMWRRFCGDFSTCTRILSSIEVRLPSFVLRPVGGVELEAKDNAVDKPVSLGLLSSQT